MTTNTSKKFPVYTVLAVTARLPFKNPHPAYDLVRHVLGKPDMDVTEVIKNLGTARNEIVRQHPQLTNIEFPQAKLAHHTDYAEREEIIKKWTPTGVSLQGYLEILPVATATRSQQSVATSSQPTVS